MIVPSYKPAYVYGGPIRSIATLCEELVKANHHVTVYTTNANGSTELTVKLDSPTNVEGVNVIYHNRWTRDHTHLSPSLLSRFYKTAGSFDVIHIHSWWNLVVVPVTWICWIKKIIPVISLRGTMTEFSVTHKNQGAKKWMHSIVGRRLLNRSFLHSTSSQEDQRLSEFITNNKRYIIPNILEIPEAVEGYHEDTPCFKLVFLGRIDPAKNIELLLETLNGSFSIPYQLTMIGEGEGPYAENLIQRTNRNEHIIWLGNLDGTDKWKELAKADLLVLPSHIENYGNVVLEALSQGTPVLVSENVGSKDFVVKNQLGWVAKPTKEDWVKMLIDIWNQPDQRKQIRTRAPGLVREAINKKQLLGLYIDMYSECIKANKA
jgi:glycosyltransferase involved in cell wall biosynthesis